MGDSLETLVAEFLERRENGEALSAEEFAHEHAEHAQKLLEVLALLPGIEARIDGARADLPSAIGPFSVRREIARGGMGRVLEVVDTRLSAAGGGRLALKLLDGAGALSTRGRERFAREAQVLQRIDHPGVVRVVASGADGPVLWLAMELVEGETLAARVARARSMRDQGTPMPIIPVAEAVSIAARLAHALQAVHAAGLVHRDVKPANVICAPDGRVVLVDFGLVKDDASATLTRTGDLLGTPQYMSPEQARGEHSDAASDIYGVGAVLYELLTLEAPHGDTSSGGVKSSDPLQAMLHARDTPVVSVRRLAPHVPRELDWILRSALAFRRRRRTQSAARMAADLEAHLAGRPVQARPPALLARMEDLVRLRRRTIAALLGAGALIALGLFVFARVRASSLRADRALVEDGVVTWLDFDRQSESAAARDDSARIETSAKLARLQGREPFAGLLAALLADEKPKAEGSAAEAAAARGWNALRAGEHEQGLADLQLARTLAPSSPEAVILLARGAERAGRFDLATREYRAAVEMLPGRAELFARLSSAHYARKEDAEAERAIHRALELEPNEAEYHFALARVLSRQKRREAGLESALRGAALAKEAATSSQLQILAALLDDAQRFPEAQQVLLKILDRKPNDSRTLYNLAISYMSDHRYFDALDTSQKLVRDPERARARASQAWIHAGSNVKTCQECQKLYAEHPELLDFEKAEALALEALEGEFTNEVPLVCADVVRLTGRSAALKRRFEELQGAAQDDARIAALERALRMLP